MDEALDWLISVDDHIIEPPDLFDAHLPARYKAIAPQVRRLDDVVVDGDRAGVGREHRVSFAVPSGSCTTP